MRVVNASPLIVLSKLGRLDLLLEPRPDIEVVVPQAVLEEVMRGEPDDPAVSLVPEVVAAWMRVIPTPPVHASLRVGELKNIAYDYHVEFLGVGARPPRGEFDAPV